MDTLRQSPSPCSSRPSSPRTPPCETPAPVGIEAVLDQLKIKAMKTGFEFNIMVVGQSGLGKSTMVNTLFKSKVWKSTLPAPGVPTPQTLQLHSVTHVIEEKGLKLKLTVTDTPGFGDQINNSNWICSKREEPTERSQETPCSNLARVKDGLDQADSQLHHFMLPSPLQSSWEPILGYINEQYEQYLQEEILITRQRHIPDTRVHCCVYFVPPTGHCLRPLDIEFLQRLCRTVNVVPVIARADSLTIEEREAFRSRKHFDEDVNDRILNSKIRERIPFAVVGADQEHLVNGRCVLGRKTNWGVIEVENMEHCEFPLLRDLLIRSHLQDLKDITHNIHYENYRVVRLKESHQLPRGPGWVNLSPVNLAPTSAGQPTTPRPSKARKRAQEEPKYEF
ncbi:septin-12 isoform X2 [Heterocephalus glaber]|uniref:Septin n=1 Tax=Heterocephalus glaber TaxID=10181 RepID=A0AAX6Q0L2_HETGA|nr:septin-12 isoform X2 [Heterocephalus glaber]